MWQRIKNFYHFIQAFLAATYFGFPSKKLIMIGVTGTDGKTTTVNMIYQILKRAHLKVSMISSVNAVIGKKSYDTGFHVTTPNPWHIQKYLKEMVEAGSEYAVLEVTSHGLDQNRVAFIDFQMGVVTNITHEHLDYHKTWGNYALAKAKLLRKVKYAILNIDDKSSIFLKPRASGKVVTFGINSQADFTPVNFPLKLKIIGDYNLYNALAAAATAHVIRVNNKVIKRALETFENLVGRMEEISEGQDFKVIVDFAHTPNSLERALTTLRSITKGKLIAVFGSAGLRDVAKRRLMGEVSARLADFTVITDEDPRTEDKLRIAQAIAKGCQKAGALDGRDFMIVLNRSDAIKSAIDIARDGDTVGIFGKGHERSMCYGTKEYPWSDQKEARKALKEKLKEH